MPETTKAYVTARFERREEMQDYIPILLAHGIEVTARWITEPHDMMAPENRGDEARQRLALENVADCLRAHIHLCFTDGIKYDEMVPGMYARGGRHAEFGIAYSDRQPIYLVGPREMVFHWLPNVVQFDSFVDFISYWDGEHS